jgi:alpha-mannosidase
VGEKAVDATIQDWGGFIGQWDDRIWEGKEMTGLKPGFIKRAKVAWFASHRHTADGANEPYAYSYLFAYPLDVPAGATTLTLPDNRKIRILAISVAEEGATVKPVQPLYDTLER